MAASNPEWMMKQPVVYSLEGNDLLEQEALLRWLHFLQADQKAYKLESDADQFGATGKTNNLPQQGAEVQSCPSSWQVLDHADELPELSTDVQPKGIRINIDAAAYRKLLLSSSNSTDIAGHEIMAPGSTQPELVEELVEKISSSATHQSASAAYIAQAAISTHQLTSALQYRLHHDHTSTAVHDFTSRELAANRCASLVMEKLTPDAGQLVADPSGSSCTPELAPLQQISIDQQLCLVNLSFACHKFTPSVGASHNRASAWELHAIDQAAPGQSIAAEQNATNIADEQLKRNEEKADAAQTVSTREQAEQSSKPLIIPSFQLIEARFIRPTTTSGYTRQSSTVDDFQCNCSHSSATSPNFCGYKLDRLKDRIIRPIVRGEFCRKRPFSKSTNADQSLAASNVQPGARTEKRARIEDYVDPVLLSEACGKLRHLSYHKHANATQGNDHRMQESSSSAERSSNFDWPSAELHAMTLYSVAAGCCKSSWGWGTDPDSTKNSNGFYWPSAELQAMAAATSELESHTFTPAQLQKWGQW